MTVPMIMALVKCVALCMDAKWRLNSAGVPMHALIGIWQRCKAKAGEAANPTTDCTFEAGHFHHDASLLAMVLSNRDNFHVHRVPFQALRRLMPCADPLCLHRIKLVADPRGYHLERKCANRMPFNPIVMLDKSGAAARGISSLGLVFFICAFHVYMAVIDYCDHKLRIRDPSTLVAVVLIFKYCRSGRTLVDVRVRWAKCKLDVLGKLDLKYLLAAGAGGRTAEEGLVKYMEEEWLDDRWIRSWTIAGRLWDQNNSPLPRWVMNWIWTNNYVERFWIDVIAWLNRHTVRMSCCSYMLLSPL